MSAAENTVVFDPYVGSCYEKGRRIINKRVLVIGASHYCEHYDPSLGCSRLCKSYGNYAVAVVEGTKLEFGKHCQDFSKIVMQRYCGRLHLKEKKANHYFRTFSVFLNAFFDDGTTSVSHEQRKTLVSELAQTEFVKGAEGNTAWGANPDVFNRPANSEQLRKTIVLLKPDVIITWGARVKDAMLKIFNAKLVVEDIYQVRIEDRMMSMVASPHPCARQFNKATLNKQLRSLGVLTDRKQQEES